MTVKVALHKVAVVINQKIISIQKIGVVDGRHSQIRYFLPVSGPAKHGGHSDAMKTCNPDCAIPYGNAFHAT